MEQLKIRFDSHAFHRALVAVAIVLVSASLALQVLRVYTGHDHVLGLTPLVHVDSEANLVSWFSASMLLVAAVGSWAVAQGLTAAGERQQAAWRLFAVFLMLLSVDEGGQLHEWAQRLVERLVAPSVVGPELVVLAVAGVVGAAIVLLLFVRTLPTPTKRMVSAGLLLFFGGAIGVDSLTPALVDIDAEVRGLSYVLLSHLEEALEISGAIVLQKGILDLGVALHAPRQRTARRARRRIQRFPM